MIFFRRKKVVGGGGRTEKVERIVIGSIEISELSWDIEKGLISYNFSIKRPPRPIIAVNRKLSLTLNIGGKYRVRSVVERDLGWATLNAVYLRKTTNTIEGFVKGSPEDFTLSRLGVRYGRALLKDELIWHPICEDHLATWGLRGHIAEYVITIDPRMKNYIVPGEEAGGGRENIFRGKPELRLPGLTVIGGLQRVERKDYTYGVHTFLDLDYAEKALLIIREKIVPTVSDILNTKIAPNYKKLVALWDDIEPLASDDLIGLRKSVMKSLAKNNPKAFHETIYMVSTHLIYNTILSRVEDYWLLEALPQVASLLALDSIIGLEAVKEALKTLKDCIGYGGGLKIPSIASLKVPKSLAQRIAASCKAPLVLWEIKKRAGTEGLEDLLRCMLNRDYYNYEVFEDCLREILGDNADAYIKEYIKGKSIPS
ncbi:MAG: hypothetical protein ABWW69_06405 [Pyrodictiaceae archaeon]